MSKNEILQNILNEYDEVARDYKKIIITHKTVCLSKINKYIKKLDQMLADIGEDDINEEFGGIIKSSGLYLLHQGEN